MYNTACYIGKIMGTCSKIKRKLHKQLDRLTTERERQCIIAILLIYECGFRIGNKKSAQTRKHYGTTTLKRKHITQNNIEFIGKSHQQN